MIPVEPRRIVESMADTAESTKVVIVCRFVLVTAFVSMVVDWTWSVAVRIFLHFVDSGKCWSQDDEVGREIHAQYRQSCMFK